MPISPYIADLRAKIGHDLIMMPGVAAFICNDQDEILLQRRSDNGRWGLPGGAMEPGEEPADAVVREVREETGLRVEPDKIIGVYSGPDLQGIYPNGDEYQVFGIIFACRVLAGNLSIDQDESLELKYFHPDNLPMTIMGHHRKYITQAVKQEVTTYFVSSRGRFD